MSEPINGNLMSDQIEGFAVCLVDAIERRGAMGCSLSRIDGGESRPFSVIVVRTFSNDYLGYVNRCPHESVRLNIGSGAFSWVDRSSDAAGTVQDSRSTL
ncbi:hypothetical protein [Bradyrhizobium sp. ERR14]|uniref:hypothetical protein n=1 Tax=Bradyrhizobium sp. ERR14 TaxID=2663837 RepID=UPI0017F9A586|nr:hypothetical protein [Bradyrhizobium sp. ERR14]MBB4397109.1 nitrite reductase/ring-hydroxylating ferredoxin subunit [Bradyrhizobium sp. ERR14]